MKINSLYISAFGKIKNLKIDFDDRLNVIFADNESGKSTVMAFIKMMFYGSERASSQISKNPRAKYTPWDGSAMAGSIDFELNGKRYRLEREFRRSNSTDKVTLWDLDLGQSKPVTADIGNTLLGLSAAAFERSVFVGQFGFPESDSAAEGEINAKLSNIALTGDQSVSFEAVRARLEKAKLALMSKSGRAGEYDKNLRLSAELKDKIALAERAEAEISAKKAESQSLAAEIAQLKTNALELKTKLSTEQDIRNLNKFKTLLELKSELDRLSSTLTLKNGENIDETFVRKVKFCISKYEAAEAKYNIKQNEASLLEESINAALNPPENATEQQAELLKTKISSLEAQQTALDSQIADLQRSVDELCNEQNNTKNSKKKVNPALIIIGALGIVSAVVLFALKLTVFSAVALTLGGILALLAFILKPKNAQLEQRLSSTIADKNCDISRLTLSKSELVGAIARLDAQLSSIESALKGNSALLETHQSRLDICKAVLVELGALCNQEKQTLFELFGNFKTVSSLEEINRELEGLTEKTSKQKELKQQINYILKDIGNISYEQARAKLQSAESYAELSEDFDSIKAEYELLINDIGDKNSAIAALKTELKALTSTTENSEQLKNRLAALNRTLLSQKEFCDTADIALEALNESFSEVRRSFGSVLEQKAGEIFSKLTDQKYSSMTISKSFDIALNESDSFGSREIAYLSSGAADQAYLSLRLALSELIFENSEQLPILLDDALAQYDDQRTKTALAFLKDYSNAQQTVMFTCHSAISNLAEQLGAKVQKL